MKRIIAIISVLVLLFTSGCSQEKDIVSVEKFGNMAKGLWVNLNETEDGYECVYITKEGSWRYKYIIYEKEAFYNMEIKEVKKTDNTYNLTLYNPGGYKEVYGKYVEEEYRYVDLIISDGIMVSNSKEYKYFSDFGDFGEFKKR